MIETLYGIDRLDGPVAFFAALLIGLLFGFVLERAGFGSSRRLAGIFYLRDMTVLKVMFTALVTAMLGLILVRELGLIGEEQIFLLPTVYGAQVVGGLIFGVGFAMGGWCPGTAAVGAVSGKLDALVFLGGAALGSVFFNEVYTLVEPLYRWGAQSEALVAFGMAPIPFAFLMTCIAVGAFWFSEWVERRNGAGGVYLGSRFLRTLGLALVFVAASLFIFSGSQPAGARSGVAWAGAPDEVALLQAVEEAEDHVEPEDLAGRLLRGEAGLLVVDVRPPDEFAAFHIRGAVNVPIPELAGFLEPYRNAGTIVLYSNGMTHPAQARDSLARGGYGNVFHLTDGLTGFSERCLTPVSLRAEPVPAALADRIRAWRAYFLGTAAPPPPSPEAPPSPVAEELLAPVTFPGYATTAWLAENLGRPGIRVIDVRSQNEYNTSHLPGSVALNVESFRGVVGGVSSSLLPAVAIREHLSLMGISPDDAIVFVVGDKLRDATLLGMGLLRVHHARWTLLQGGFARWSAEGRALDTRLPEFGATDYPASAADEDFSIDYRGLLRRIGDGRTVILDARPADYFAGKKSDEARAGHIPGAINRSFEADLDAGGQLLPVSALNTAYSALIPDRAAPVIVHCRTGHQASQTFFVLRFLLGYTDVKWYDGGWTEWAARPELPIE